MLQISRFIRWLLAISTQKYLARLIKRLTVLTSRCYKLISDQLSILLSSTRRRHRLPRL